jgi:hypothetical protein
MTCHRCRTFLVLLRLLLSLLVLYAVVDVERNELRLSGSPDADAVRGAVRLWDDRSDIALNTNGCRRSKSRVSLVEGCTKQPSKDREVTPLDTQTQQSATGSTDSRVKSSEENRSCAGSVMRVSFLL